MNSELLINIKNQWPRFAVLSFLSFYLCVGLFVLGFNKSIFEVLWIVFLCFFFQAIQTVFWKDDRSSILGAIITAVGSAILINAGNNQLAFYLFPCFIAIASKLVFRSNGKHLFNPSLVGILFSILFTADLISVTPGYQWGSYNLVAILVILPAFLVVLPAIKRGWLTGSFLFWFTVFLVIRAEYLDHSMPFRSLFWGSLTSPAFFLFACFMITDPPTSPAKRNDQLLVGFLIALVDFFFHFFELYYTFFYAAAVVASSRFIYSKLKQNGFAQTKIDFFKYLKVSQVRWIYFLIGFCVFNPLTWAMLEKQKPDIRFTISKNSHVMSQLAAPMIDFKDFPIDERIRHLTKWLIFTEGIAVADIDGNGYQDVFVLNSLKQNERRGLFLMTDSTGHQSEMILSSVSHFLTDYRQYGLPTSAVFVDDDGDGDQDLFITFVGGASGGLKVFRNQKAESGKLSFVESSEKLGLSEYTNSIALTFLDFNQDGTLDLFLTTVAYTYLPAYSDSIKFDIFNLPPAENPQDFRPTEFLNDSWYDAWTSTHNFLYLGSRGSYLKQNSEDLGLKETKISLAVGSSDLNQDSYPDLYVANDSGSDDLYLNQNGQKFVRVMGTNSREVGKDYYKGMNVTMFDADRNGSNDIYVSNIHHPFVVEGSMLWHFLPNAPEASENQSPQFGLLNENRWGWGALARDFDNDGWTDLIQTNGMFDSSWEKSDQCFDYFYLNEKLMRSDSALYKNARSWANTIGACLFAKEANRFYLMQPEKHKFLDIAEYLDFTSKGEWRGVAAADFLNNGSSTLFFTSPYHPAEVFDIKPNSTQNWIGLELVSENPKCHREALNSLVRIAYRDQSGKETEQFQEKLLVNGLSAQTDSRLRFGLGNSPGLVDIEIKWCGKFSQRYQALSHNQYHKIVLKP